MSTVGELVFVDTGAWIALAVVRDPLHDRAREHWEALQRRGAKLLTSLPVLLETFTYLDRRGTRGLAQAWRRSLDTLDRFEIDPCGAADLVVAWTFLDQTKFHKLSLVDAMSFALMRRRRCRTVFAFDIHFGIAGFRYVT